MEGGTAGALAHLARRGAADCAMLGQVALWRCPHCVPRCSPWAGLFQL